MKEVNYIIQNVSHKSLIIMDELGRGMCIIINKGKCNEIMSLTHVKKFRDNLLQVQLYVFSGTCQEEGVGICHSICEHLLRFKVHVYISQLEHCLLMVYPVPVCLQTLLPVSNEIFTVTVCDFTMQLMYSYV